MAERQGRVVVVGSSNVDMVVGVDHVPGPGETVISKSYFTTAGGKGANQAVAAARMGAQVSFVACVGRDAFGAQAIEDFQKDRIDVRGVEMVDGVSTGTAFIWIEPGGENRIVVVSGANACLTCDTVEKNAAAIASADVLLCQLEVSMDAVARALEIARGARVITILNPAPARSVPKQILSLVDIITPNWGEAVALWPQLSDPEKMQNVTPEREELSLCFHRAGIATVCMTLGRSGCQIHSVGQAPLLVPAGEVSVVDTTAAGDTFSGSLAALLASGVPLPVAASTAVAAASLACTRLGAQVSIPTLSEVRALRE